MEWAFSELYRLNEYASLLNETRWIVIERLISITIREWIWIWSNVMAIFFVTKDMLTD